VNAAALPVVIVRIDHLPSRLLPGLGAVFLPHWRGSAMQGLFFDDSRRTRNLGVRYPCFPPQRMLTPLAKDLYVPSARPLTFPIAFAPLMEHPGEWLHLGVQFFSCRNRILRPPLC